MFNAYTKAYNKQNTRKGSLFIPRFNRKPITSESYLKNTINYIHQNPIAHKFANELQDWKYASYNGFLSDNFSLICTQETIALFGDIDNFIFYHNLKQAEQLALDMGLDY